VAKALAGDVVTFYQRAAEAKRAVIFTVAESPAQGHGANMKFHRGRLIDHVHLVVEDLPAAQRFYTAVLGVLGIPIGGKGDDYFQSDELFVSTTKLSTGTPTGRVHLAFAAANRGMVDKFYAAALEAGGKDNGKPGERPYHPGYYAAFVLDPAGNNIEAVYHGPSARSAESVVIDAG
jgi:catechol 2,3-dioxygenase-like lactoylglutathione lyase family enzyme